MLLSCRYIWPGVLGFNEGQVGLEACACSTGLTSFLLRWQVLPLRETPRSRSPPSWATWRLICRCRIGAMLGELVGE